MPTRGFLPKLVGKPLIGSSTKLLVEWPLKASAAAQRTANAIIRKAVWLAERGKSYRERAGSA